MSGHTITPTRAEAAATVAGRTSRRSSLALSRAAQELDLKRGEFDLAVRLGRVRTVPDEGGGGRRVTRAEVDRVRAEDGFPEVLRGRVETVGTRDGAALMEVTPGRFTRFARLGLVVPVNWYVNRYRAVVWLYLADEVRQFAVEPENARLLTGRTPEGLRGQLETGLDLRPRNWRGRHLGFELRQAEDPWAKAAVVASLLDPVQTVEIVRDPYERAHLDRLRPVRPGQPAPESPAASIAARIMTAQDCDEIDWLRAELAQTLIEARRHRPAPRPTPRPPDPRPPMPGCLPTARGEAMRVPEDSLLGRTSATQPEQTRSRSMLGWLRRRDA
ncbi:DUF6397 family protein [Streptomyces sp. NPDC004393]|uniref:DUF6397 family protein n=1 Tax=Streptomyces sp. NPDC004533 TaxID=3154278 RepID=UPI0033BB3B63